MTSMAAVRNFLAERRIAVVGVSRNPNDFTRTVYREFRKRGYDLVPVHPDPHEVDGQHCRPRVTSIESPPAAALVLTPAVATDSVLADCVAAGVKRVWLYRAGGAGAVSANAETFCRDHGIEVVAGECPLMFFADASFPHRLHGWVRKIRGVYPQ